VAETGGSVLVVWIEIALPGTLYSIRLSVGTQAIHNHLEWTVDALQKGTICPYGSPNGVASPFTAAVRISTST
jgi:hypothetical protein